MVAEGRLERTDLKRYVPHVVVATLVVAGAPMALAYSFATRAHPLSFLVATVLSVALSLTLARVGAALWERRPASRDVVFDDLMIWGFVRRIVNHRRVIRNAERLALHTAAPGTSDLDRKEHLAVLRSLATALESGDPFTHGHSDRVARHAYMVARTMRLPKAERDRIRLAAALHDVGKLETPPEVLLKAGRLTDEEFEIIKQHPVAGAALVADLNDPDLTAMVLHHHERIDGSGYPNGLRAAEIPLGASIISVADTFDAITSNRPYRPSRSHKQALDILRREAGTKLDADVVNAFLAYYTGRRGIRAWFLGLNAAQRAIEFSIVGLQRALANAAVVATASAVVAGGAVGPVHVARDPGRPPVARRPMTSAAVGSQALVAPGPESAGPALRAPSAVPEAGVAKGPKHDYEARLGGSMTVTKLGGGSGGPKNDKDEDGTDETAASKPKGKVEGDGTSDPEPATKPGGGNGSGGKTDDGSSDGTDADTTGDTGPGKSDDARSGRRGPKR